MWLVRQLLMKFKIIWQKEFPFFKIWDEFTGFVHAPVCPCENQDPDNTSVRNLFVNDEWWNYLDSKRQIIDDCIRYLQSQISSAQLIVWTESKCSRSPKLIFDERSTINELFFNSVILFKINLIFFFFFLECYWLWRNT